MDDIQLRDSEDKATDLINQQLKKIIETNDTESLNSGCEDFDIPEVHILPSLEDILSQDDPLTLLDSDIREDIDSYLLTDDDLVSVISSCSFSSLGNTNVLSNEVRTKKKLFGEVIKCTGLSLLGGMCNRDDKASAITIKNKLVCIGFKSGKISAMMIDGEISGEISNNKVYESGAVTSLSIDDGILASSFSTGVIHIWDLKNNSHTQKIDMKVTDTTITKVVVIDRTHLLYAVSQGSVFDVKLTKTLSIRSSESTCLFSGSHGEVIDLQKLNVEKSHDLYSYCIIGLCTFKQVMLISLKPYPNIKYSVRLWGDVKTLPIINWYYHEQDCSKPKLLIGRGSRFVMYTLNVNTKNQVFLRKLKSCSLEFQLISIFWFNTNTVAILDTSEKIHLIDVHTLMRLQTISNVSDIGMCYNTASYRSLATGGNVSKAMFAASQYACYNSLSSYPGGTWILGCRDVLKIVSNPWRKRIDDLKNDLHFSDALELVLTFYSGKGKGVSSLVFRDMQRVKNSCIEIMIDIFSTYIEESQQDLSNLGIALKNCINACVITNNTHLVYEEIYTRISKIGAVQRVFYETLEPFIFNNKISSLNPVLMKNLLEYFKENNKLQSFEKCILHLDPINLDIHNSLILCTEYDMYEAILFIYNACLHDFTTPLNRLLNILDNQLTENNKTHKRVGYVILMYISNCLVGNIPDILGNVDQDEVTKIQNLVFNSVFCKHSEKAPPEEPEYPFVKRMLKLDTREFLNVMSVSFGHPMCLPINQIVIDILLHVMIEEGHNYTPLQIGHLFTFLARQKVVNEFYLDKKYLDQALDCLATNDITGHEEREQALLELVLTIGIEEFNEDRLLALSESAEFYQVCEVIYDKRKEYDKVLFCYWSDTSRIDKVFSFIYHIMEGSFSEDDKANIRNTCVQNIGKLISINNEETATLILKVFSEDIEKIVYLLDGQPRVLYSLLQCVYDISKGSEEPEINNVETHHIYIKLMSRYNPEFVCPYLQVASGYKIDIILEICLIANLKDAAAYLYETRGDLEDAFKLYYDVLRDTIRDKQMVFVEETLTKVINFCQRNSHQLSQNNKESYWFSLIDLLLGLGEDRDCITLQETLIDNMLGFVSSSKVLDKLIKSSSNKTFKTYGDIKKVVGNMLDTLMYEDVLLKSTKRIVHHDIYTALRKDRSEFVKGIDVNKNLCVICCQNITPADMGFLIFNCSHLSHTTCVDHMCQKYCVLCESDQSSYKNTRQILNKAISMDVPYHQTHFETWRINLNNLRKALNGENRMDLIHELCDDGFDSRNDINEDDFHVDLTAEFSDYYNDVNMDGFMSSHVESSKISDNDPQMFSSSSGVCTNNNSSFQKVSNFSQKSLKTARECANTDRVYSTRKSDPFKENSDNPFGTETPSSVPSNNPFGDDVDSNPFAENYNPFAEDI